MKKQCDAAWSGNKTACRYFGADPDGAYCGHPKSLEVTMYGLSPNAMSREGICTHGENGEYQLWEGPKDDSPAN